MKHLSISKALPNELDRVYLMGFDIWGDGNSETHYLNECRASKKYKKGVWYVLKEGEQLLSSLIVYDFEMLFLVSGQLQLHRRCGNKGMRPN